MGDIPQRLRKCSEIGQSIKEIERETGPVKNHRILGAMASWPAVALLGSPAAPVAAWGIHPSTHPSIHFESSSGLYKFEVTTAGGNFKSGGLAGRFGRQRNLN